MNMHASLPLIEAISAQLVADLGEDFDAATFWDTLDGETDAMDLIGRLIRERQEADAFAAANKALATEYSARSARMAQRKAALTKALGAILDATGQTKVAHPLATVSRTKGRQSVEITDEASVPSQLCRIVRSPDLVAIREQIEAGVDVPGAALRAGEPGLTVRVK